jgi:tetratricopeptide (TPR) repeat protein
MKKQLLCFAISLNVLSLTSQTNRFDQSAPSQPYVSQYVPTDFETLKRIGDAMEAKYEKNKEYKNKLIDWIFDLKSKTSDKEFLNAMNFQYNKLNSIEISSSSGESLDLIRQNIKEEIDKLNTRVKEEPNRLWESGNNNFKNENFIQAIKDYTNLIQLNPDFPLVYRKRGEAYLNLGNLSSALTDLNKYLELVPNDKFALYSRGFTKRELKDYMGALLDLNKLIELDPSSSNAALAYFERARAKSGLGDSYGSITDNTKAIELKPNNSMAYNNRGWDKFVLKKYAEALIDLNKSIELDPSNWIAYDSRQETKFALNDFKGCIEDCNTAISLNPKCANSFLIRGRAYYKQGNKIKACEDWSKAGELGVAEAYTYISKYCK